MKKSSPYNTITKKKKVDKENPTYTKKFKPKFKVPAEHFGVKSYSMNNTIINNSLPNSRSTSISRSKLKKSPVQNYFLMGKAKPVNKDIQCVQTTENYPIKQFIDVTDTESNDENYISFDTGTPDIHTLKTAKKRYSF